MQKDVLIRGINAETRSPIVCVVDRPSGITSPESILLSLREFQLTDSIAVITNSGLQHLPEISRLTRQFRSQMQYKSRRDEKFETIWSGGEGTVYRSRQDKLVTIKEQRKNAFPDKSPTDRLVTMEALRHYVGQTPGLEHVRVPEQYGFVNIPSEIWGQITISAMQYIDGYGLKQLYYEREPIHNIGVQYSEIEEAIVEVKDIIKNGFDSGVATASPNIHPDDLEDRDIPIDLQTYRNFLVDPNTPSGNRPYTIWVIDQ